MKREELTTIRLKVETLGRPLRVFIASPYAGEVERNVRRAKRLVVDALALHCAPYAPHLLYVNHLDDNNPVERQRGIDAGLAWLEACDEVWSWGLISPGMLREIEHANSLGIKVRFPWGLDPSCVALVRGCA